MIATNMDELIELALDENLVTPSQECDFTCEIEGYQVHVYEASIAYRDILLYTDNGWFNYMVDTYGDRTTIELFEYELDKLDQIV